MAVIISIRGRAPEVQERVLPALAEDQAVTARALEAKVWPLLAAGEVKPIIHSIFPLAQAADAHRLMESSAHIGKIILEIA